MGTVSKYNGMGTVSNTLNGMGTVSNSDLIPGVSLMSPFFFANLLSTVLTDGVGTLMPAAIGDTDGNRLTLDNEGVWHPVKAEEVRQYGQRRVENLISFSEDMTQSAYGTAANAVIDSATQATYDGTVNGQVFQNVTVPITSGAAAETWIFSVKIRVVSGTITGLSIGCNGDAVTGGEVDISSSVSSTLQRFSFPVTADASAGTLVRCNVFCDDAATLEITDWQLEESTGRSDTTTPSSYISTGVGTGSELVIDSTASEWTASGTNTVVDDGADGVKVTYVDDVTGARINFTGGVVSDALVVGATYLVTCQAKVNTGTVQIQTLNPTLQKNVTSTTFVTVSIVAICTSATTFGVRTNSMGAGEIMWVKDLSVKQIDHGANVDGVIYSPYENGNTVNSNVVTEAQGAAIAITPPEYVELSGNSGSYVSTPDSAAVSITGDIDIRIRLSLDDWVSGAFQTIIDKGNVSPTLSYRLIISDSGHPLLDISQNGSTISRSISSAAPSVSDGDTIWMRVTYAEAGNVNFYTSTDDTNDDTAVTWSQLGNPDIANASTAIFDSSASLILNGLNGTRENFAGNTYRATIYNGIGGTLAADFNAADGAFTTPKSLTSSTTGEVWTVNGDAYLSTSESPINYLAPLGYVGQGTATELSGRGADIGGS